MKYPNFVLLHVFSKYTDACQLGDVIYVTCFECGFDLGLLIKMNRPKPTTLRRPSAAKPSGKMQNKV